MEAAAAARSLTGGWRSGWLWPAAVTGGAIAGAASAYPYEYVSGPAHLLGNSAAVWLLLPFGLFAVFWLGAAAVGGPVFGCIGNWWRSGSIAAGGIAPAVLGASFIAEAVTFQDTAGAGVAVIAEVAFGVLVTFGLARGRRQQRLVAPAALPLLVLLGAAGLVPDHAPALAGPQPGPAPLTCNH